MTNGSASLAQTAGGARSVAQKIAGFAVVGVITYVVDAVMLKALINLLSFSPYSGRLISLPAALFANWYLNRTLVFAAPKKASGSEIGRFLTARAFSASMNYAIYSSMLLAARGRFDLDPVIAVAAATIIMMAPNFLVMRIFVFRPH